MYIMPVTTNTQLLGIGDRAPDFTLPNDTGSEVSLSQLHADGNVIVYFYPAAMTPGCTKQACDFSAAAPTLSKAGYRVAGISPDTPAKLATFRTTDQLDLSLLSDPDHVAMTAYGAWGEKTSYGRTVTGVIRSTFVIDNHGIITQAWRGVKATGHVGRVLAALGLG